MESNIVDGLGEDLLLLSLRADKGNLATGDLIDYALMASELVRLAARGRIEIQADHVVVRDEASVGDAELDAALDGLSRAKRPPQPRKWFASRPSGLALTYLKRLVSSGALRSEPRRIVGTRWLIADPARVADARARLDAIALSAGQVDVAQAAFGGLAHAISLDDFLYPGKANRSARERLDQIAKGQWTGEAVTGAVTDAAAIDTTAAGTRASIRAVVQAATNAVIEVARAHRGAPLT